MASHDFPEQDTQGGDDLPTYDDLAERHGANSRFGRWRSWIEKRAAERYADVTPEELERRRQRGWELGEAVDPIAGVESALNKPSQVRPPSIASASGSSQPRLSVQTLRNLPGPPPTLPEPDDELSIESQLLVSETLEPTHLCVKQFGSRFLPHTKAPIHALLPVLGDRLLLVGHENGLSVMNMFPQDWGEDGLISKGPSEAQVHPIWEGEGVFQMTLLEVESTAESIPQGVLLVLVGTELETGSKDEPYRTLRMYNLASLISLAKWASANKGVSPLQLGWPADWNGQETSSKRRKRTSGHFARGIKSLMGDSPTHLQPEHSSFPDARRSSSNERPPPLGRSDTYSSWDVVDDLPLRWATDFVPLASNGSRLSNTSVVTYALWRDQRQVRGSALLAVATKATVLLYESPKGERAFRFVKDFYTPVTSRSLAFVYQAAQDSMSRSPSDANPSKHTRQTSHHIASQRHVSAGGRPVQYGQQLSLFIVFEKKAGLIRLADSAVSEVEMFDDTGSVSSISEAGTSSTLSSPLRHNRRGRNSSDSFAFLKDHKGHWALPATAEVPFEVAGQITQAVYCLTRGKKTHILTNPLPASIAYTSPLRALKWQSSPTSVTARVLRPDDRDRQPYLQLVAASEDGVEVQEFPTIALFDRKEKGRAEESLHSQTSFGGSTGLLCAGGHWDRPYDAPLARSYSTSSVSSYSSMDTEELIVRLQEEQGLYGWQRRGLDDYRIFWAGGTGHGDTTSLC
ncbi:hypothetical protein K488DRAFT_78186 [Vararia minispora EC-137]|uniref:Uncharacterized protein n=1 Tax=Vararia minispora EC-137 TaxID=1314806 RepID=A0ACB8QMU8_9AGAM|nr:hypothetical protein K488DRAFT_78186 [Vararia minispora EC-137]